MSSEAALRKIVRRELAPFGVVHRIENACDRGTPDITYALTLAGKHCSGWLELKETTEPKRSNTIVRLGLRPEQVNFAEDWSRAGGACHVLAQVGRAYFLLPGLAARAAQEGLTMAGLEAVAVASGRGTFPTGAVLRALSTWGIKRE